MSNPRTLDFYVSELPCKKKGFGCLKKSVVATFNDGHTFVIEITDKYELDTLYFHQDLVKGLEKSRTTGGLIRCSNTNAGWRMSRAQWEKRATYGYGIEV